MITRHPGGFFKMQWPVVAWSLWYMVSFLLLRFRLKSAPKWFSITYRRRLNRFVRSKVAFQRAQLFRSQGMARQTRATSRSSGGKEAKAAPRPPIRWVLLKAYQFLWKSVLPNWLGLWTFHIKYIYVWHAIWTYIFLRSTGGENELSAVIAQIQRKSRSLKLFRLMDYFKWGPSYPGVIIICFLPTVFLTGWRLG